MQKINKNLAATQEQFWKYYNSNLREIYQQLEPIRQKHLSAFIRRLSFFICVSAFVYALCRFDFIPENIYNSEGFFKTVIFIGLIYLCYTFYPFQQYCDKTKSMVMKKLLSFWGNFNYYNNRYTLFPNDIQKSELFTCYNRSDVDDTFAGKYKNTSISVSEHKLYLHGNRGDVNTFKGVLILLKFNKHFTGKTVVRSKFRWINIFWDNPLLVFLFGFPLTAVAFISVKTFDLEFALRFFGVIAGVVCLCTALVYLFYSFKNRKKAKKQIILEGISFLRQWNVTATDQIKARYILTPSFMEKMLNIKKLFHGKHIDFSFFDDKLLIAVHTQKDLFETTSLLTSALRYTKVREVVNQLYSIFSIIDILELENTSEQKQKTIKKSSFKQSL